MPTDYAWKRKKNQMAKKELSFGEYLDDKYGGIRLNKDENVKSISTGSLSLDYCTGVGGIPIGRFTELYGPESSGKTTVMLETARNALLGGGKVLYFDTEHGLDQEMINEVVGKGTEVDSEWFVHVQTTLADTIFDLCEKALDSKEFSLIVIDSLAMIVSKAERENPFDKDTMGQAPRIISKFLRRNSDSIRESGTAFVFINQVRDVIGAYVHTMEAPGGHAIKHSCSLRISFSATSSKNNRIMVGDEEIGVVTNFVIRKNKLDRPFRTFSVPILWGYGVDRIRDVVEFASTLGVLNGTYYKFNLDGVETNLGHGLQNTIEFLENNKDVLDKVIKACYATATKDTPNSDSVYNKDVDGLSEN